MYAVFYVSGHGLGHAARSIEVMHALRALLPDIFIAVRTAAPKWVFEAGTPGDVEIEGVETDTGVVQIDSLRLDEEATARETSRFYRDFARRVEHEAAAIRIAGADLVVGDIPPLAFAAAHAAGVPSLAVGNFTWDWIYSAYSAFERQASDVIPIMQRAYATATRALRLPLHGGFEPMRAAVHDIPFIARKSTRERHETRRVLNLPANRPVVLASFGAYGADLPLDALCRSDRFTLIAPVREPPAGLRYPDLVAASDVVVSKPGYGIVSECIANGAALLYTSRGRFAEYDVFVAEMPRLLRCRYLSQEDLLAGRWADAIDALLAQPEPAERPRIDGADVAADHIIKLGIE